MTDNGISILFFRSVIFPMKHEISTIIHHSHDPILILISYDFLKSFALIMQDFPGKKPSIFPVDFRTIPPPGADVFLDTPMAELFLDFLAASPSSKVNPSGPVAAIHHCWLSFREMVVFTIIIDDYRG